MDNRKAGPQRQQTSGVVDLVEKLVERHLTEAEKAEVAALGGFEGGETGLQIAARMRDALGA